MGLVALIGSTVPALVATAAPAAALDPPTRAQGAGPYADILHWADVYKCGGLTQDQLAAMIMVPTYTETGADGPTVAPSPMTLSRYDNQTALYAFNTKGLADKAFFHPGIGEWQWDSAGGWSLTAATAIDTATAAKQAAITISSRYCASTQTDLAKRRAYAWAPWLYCTSDPEPTRCETGYAKILQSGVLNVASLAGIQSTGGMEWRTCEVAGIGTLWCGFVDPSKAQGLKSFIVPGYGPAPISAPFYVFEHGGREYRYWLKTDTGYAQTISAFKNVTANARSGLTWQYSETLCDRSLTRGFCDVSWSGFSEAGFTVTPGGRVVMGTNQDRRLEAWAIGTDQKIYHRWQTAVNGGWSLWYTLGGQFPVGTTPTVGLNADGRMEVFATGTDGQLWHSWQHVPNASWSPLYPMGSAGTFTGATVLGANLDGRIELFARGGDGRLWHTWQVIPSGWWSSWYPYDGLTMAAGTVPAVATNTDGRQQLVVLGTDGGLRTAKQVIPNMGWSGFSSIGGGPFVASKSPVLARNADGRLEIFIAGDVYGVVYHSWQPTPSGGFGSFFPYAAASSTTPTAVLDRAGKLTLLLVGPGGAITVLRQLAPNGNWGPVQSLGGVVVSAPSVGPNQDGRLLLHTSNAAGVVYTANQNYPPT